MSLNSSFWQQVVAIFEATSLPVGSTPPVALFSGKPNHTVPRLRKVKGEKIKQNNLLKPIYLT